MKASRKDPANLGVPSKRRVAGIPRAVPAMVMILGGLLWPPGVAHLCALIATASAAEATDTKTTSALPALSREWRGVDYQAVAAAISKGELPLPRFSGEPGAMLLRKITSLDNLHLLVDTALPVESRLQEVTILMPAANSIMLAYVTPANNGEKVNAEMAALLSFMLHVASAQAVLVEEYLPTIPHDAKYATRMEGAKTVGAGLANMFSGAETSLTEGSFYSSDDISLLLQGMADTLPAVKTMFASDFRLELLRKLTIHRKRAIRSEDIKNLDRMLADLQT
jgi:hypothetical protein